MAAIVTITNERADAVRIVNVAWTSHTDGAATGTIYVTGIIHKFVTNPGSAAPDDNYDITLLDVDGVDVANSLLLNRHTTNTQEVYPYKELTLTGSVPAAVPLFHGGPLTFTLAAAGSTKTGNLRIYYR